MNLNKFAWDRAEAPFSDSPKLILFRIVYTPNEEVKATGHVSAKRAEHSRRWQDEYALDGYYVSRIPLAHITAVPVYDKELEYQRTEFAVSWENSSFSHTRACPDIASAKIFILSELERDFAQNQEALRPLIDAARPAIKDRSATG